MGIHFYDLYPIESMLSTWPRPPLKAIACYFRANSPNFSGNGPRAATKHMRLP